MHNGNHMMSLIMTKPKLIVVELIQVSSNLFFFKLQGVIHFRIDCDLHENVYVSSFIIN